MVVMSYNQHPQFDFPEEIQLNPYVAKMTLTTDNNITVADFDGLGLDGSCMWVYRYKGDIEGHQYLVEVYVLRTIKVIQGMINGDKVFSDEYNKFNELDDAVKIRDVFYDVVRETRRQLRCMVDEQKRRDKE